MASIRTIRRRIRSVRNIAQITKAMEMVAASKMRRAQSNVIASRPYAETMRSLLAQLAGPATRGTEPEDLHPLLRQRPVSRSAIILITSDRGLAASLNSNVIRTATAILLEKTDAGLEVPLVTVGRKGRDFMMRHRRDVIAEFTDMKDRPTLLDVAPIANLVVAGYTAGEFDAVDLVYTRFYSTLVQRPEVLPLLPITAGTETPANLEYIYEPDAASVLSALLPRFVEVQIYKAMLEAIASEQSARMVAMRNATENAQELIQELTLTYNKVRQAGITREVTEIAAAAQALRETS